MDVSWLYKSILIVVCLTSVYCQCRSPPSPTFCEIVDEMFPLPIQSEKCCNISRISRYSIEIDYFVTQTDNSEDRCRLDASIRWQAPTDDDGYTYSIDFLPTVTLDDLILTRLEAIDRRVDCPEPAFFNPSCPTGHSFSTVVEEETANFTSILFGFRYRFQVQVIYDGTISAISTCYGRCSEEGPTPNLQAPDCLNATGDIEFCQNQPIPVATEPRDVEVEWTIESMSVIVHIMWSMPLVVNGEIARYQIYAARGTTVMGDTIILVPTQVNGTEIQIRPDSPGVRNEGFLPGYSYLILVEPIVDLPEQYRSERTHTGNIATRRITIPTIDVTTISERRQTVTERVTSSTSTEGDASDLPLAVILVLSISAVLLVVAFVVILLVYQRNRKSAVRDQGVSFQMHPSRHEVVREVQPLPEFKDKEIYHIDDIELVGEPIGGGQYGKVYKGYLRLEMGTDNQTIVAVKTTKDGINAAMQEEFLDEIRLMINIGEHPNIMPVIACRTVAEPYYLITEYMDYGSLKDYLRKCNKREHVEMDSYYTLTGLRKIKIAHQISTGMAYLSSTRYFHGDLAARNILINKNMEVKISDFGLSNDIYARGYVRLPPENKRPVKWYSPEANIHGRCSTKGDVWSYGIVLHEIYCFGREPYQGMAPREVIVRVNNGYRLEKPEDCPDEVYGIMMSCWQFEASLRPTFESIKQSLEKLLDSGDFAEEDEQNSNVQENSRSSYRASQASMYLSFDDDPEKRSSSIFD